MTTDNMTASEEILDIFTRNGEYLGTRTRSECHQDSSGYYHKPVWIWIVNDDGRFLVQKRSNLKRLFPGYYDIPSAGHLTAGEDSVQGAIRETREELGIDTKPEDYQYIGEYISDTTWELGQVYLLRNSTPVEDMAFCKEEVESAEWLSFNEFRKLLESGSFVPYDDGFKKMSIDLLRNVRPLR